MKVFTSFHKKERNKREEDDRKKVEICMHALVNACREAKYEKHNIIF